MVILPFSILVTLEIKLVAESLSWTFSSDMAKSFSLDTLSSVCLISICIFYSVALIKVSLS